MGLKKTYLDDSAGISYVDAYHKIGQVTTTLDKSICFEVELYGTQALREEGKNYMRVLHTFSIQKEEPTDKTPEPATTLEDFFCKAKQEVELIEKLCYDYIKSEIPYYSDAVDC